MLSPLAAFSVDVLVDLGGYLVDWLSLMCMGRSQRCKYLPHTTATQPPYVVQAAQYSSTVACRLLIHSKPTP